MHEIIETFFVFLMYKYTDTEQLKKEKHSQFKLKFSGMHDCIQLLVSLKVCLCAYGRSKYFEIQIIENFLGLIFIKRNYLQCFGKSLYVFRKMFYIL